MFEMLAGGILGVILTIILDQPFRMIIGRIKKSLLNIYYHFNPPKRKLGDTFSWGSRATSIKIIDGNGIVPYSNDNISTVITTTPKFDIPELEYFKVKYIEKIDKDKAESKKVPWNGELLSLHKYDLNRVENTEELKLLLYLYKIDYYTVSASTHNLFMKCESTGKALAEYMYNYSFESMDKYPLPNGIGICIMVKTKDNKLVFSRRSVNSGFRAGESDVSIVEGLNPEHDIINHNIDFNMVVFRAFCEELCETEKSKLEINILGLVFDEAYSQWNIIGCVNTDLTQEDMVLSRNRGTLGKWELSNLDFIRYNLSDIMLYCASHKMWDMGLVTLYYTMIFNRMSIDKVNNAIRKYEGKNKNLS